MTLGLLFLIQFLILFQTSNSEPDTKFYLIKTGAEDGQVEEAASGEEESKQENNADYFGTGRVPSPVRGGWNPNDG